MGRKKYLLADEFWWLYALRPQSLAKVAEKSTGWLQKDVSNSNVQSISTPWLMSKEPSKNENVPTASTSWLQTKERITTDEVDDPNVQKTSTAWFQNKVSEVGQSSLSHSSTSWLQNKDESRVDQPSFEHANARYKIEGFSSV